jgi:glycosyltransferase involved in cell wall biosynthesis
MPPLISVVVPAYNTEEFIGAALESIIAQDYENVEIVVVNDASTDETAEAARAVLASRSRPYKVVNHEKNRGVAAARNTGIGAAAGGYVAFVDSDDLVDADFISCLYAAISGGGSDVAVCGYRSKEMPSGTETNHLLDVPGGENAPITFAKKAIRGDIGIYYGASLYRKEILARNGIKFTEGCVCGEDAEFFIKAIAMSGNVAFSGKCPYVYRIHEKMGSRSGHMSPDQNTKRYTDLIQARIRAGHYVIEHSNSQPLVGAARYELLPRYYLKMFTMHAWRDDKEAFFADLRSPNIRNIMMSSRKAFLKSPDILLKSLWLLWFPDMYFEYRRKHVYYYRV